MGEFFTRVSCLTLPRNRYAVGQDSTRDLSGVLDTPEKVLSAITSTTGCYGLYGIISSTKVHVRAYVIRKGTKCFWCDLPTPVVDIVL